MTEKQKLDMFYAIRKALLTVWSTGELVKHPWFLQGLDSEDKETMMCECAEQVMLLRAFYNEGDVVHITIKRAAAMVKHVIYYSAKKKLESNVVITPQMKFDTIEHLFRVQLGEEETWWTKRLIKVSEYIVRNYEGDEDIFSKFIKRKDGWYAYGWTTKTKYVDPERTRWLKSGKKERFNLLENRIGQAENEYLHDCLLWEHLVDVYQGFKTPYQASYGEIILAYNGEKGAPYCQRTARRKLKEFFRRAFIYYGINLKKSNFDFSRDCTEMLDVYGTIDMLLKERKRGYSVADVMNNNNR